MVVRLVSIVVGAILDFFFGDPNWIPHPVVFVGKLISFLEKNIRKIFPKSPTWELFGGTFLAILVPTISGFSFWLILKWASYFGAWARMGVETFMCFQILAARSLARESEKVHRALTSGNTTQARVAVGRIVGRETDQLSTEDIIRATVETVAENTSDGVVAPLLFMFFGGAPLGMVYKSINTMDSMLGYKNARYLYFGRPAAYLDDIFNWLPARITGLIFVLSAKISGENYKESFRILMRDSKKHASPNAGFPESAVAGALDIRLGGNSIYHGVVAEKAALGEDTRPVNSRDILRTNALMWWGSISFLMIGCLLTAIKFLW